MKKSAEGKSPWPQAVPFRAPGLSEAGGQQAVHPGSLRTQGGPERQRKRVMCGSQDQRSGGLEVWACPGPLSGPWNFYSMWHVDKHF